MIRLHSLDDQTTLLNFSATCLSSWVMGWWWSVFPMDTKQRLKQGSSSAPLNQKLEKPTVGLLDLPQSNLIWWWSEVLLEIKLLFKSLPQSGPTHGETLYVLEVLLNCSSQPLKSADGETPQPCGPDEKGEMQVNQWFRIHWVDLNVFQKNMVAFIRSTTFFSPQVVPILLQLVKAISSVRLYIPKDLRSLDSRQSVGKSVKVGTWWMLLQSIW